MQTVQDESVFILRNYNKFLIRCGSTFRWDDFYIHRFDSDFDKLVTFGSAQAAQDFLDLHPDLQADFDAWITPSQRSDWDGSRC